MYTSVRLADIHHSHNPDTSRSSLTVQLVNLVCVLAANPVPSTLSVLHLSCKVVSCHSDCRTCWLPQVCTAMLIKNVSGLYFQARTTVPLFCHSSYTLSHSHVPRRSGIMPQHIPGAVFGQITLIRGKPVRCTGDSADSLLPLQVTCLPLACLNLQTKQELSEYMQLSYHVFEALGKLA